MGNTLTDLGTRFAMLKELRSHHEHMAEILGSELAKIGEELFKEFTNSKQASFRLNGAAVFKDGRDRIVSPTVKYKGTIVQPMPFFELLRSTGQGSLIKTGVHDKVLTSWITEQKQKNMPLPSETILKIFNIESATVTRAPSSAKSKATKETEGEESHE
jgi:hypothetical protein